LKLYTSIHGRGGAARVHVIALFGVGLIGGEIAFSLGRAGVKCVANVPMGWNEDLSFSQALESIASLIARIADGSKGCAPLISLVWSAGNTGFSAGEDVAGRELGCFERLLKWGASLSKASPDSKLRFFHFSSAGGLFEGQTHVSGASEPSPLRVYGELKLAQERLLAESAWFGEKCIYRPSSVYGYSPKGRKGLISALIANGVRGRVTQIFGSASTIRDYVPAWQIGRFTVSELFASMPQAARGPLFLASGKPSSIFEIIRTVEAIVGRKINTAFEFSNDNALNNTYSHLVLPKEWEPIGIREGVQKVFSQWLELGF
jgi:hypothetical protein